MTSRALVESPTCYWLSSMGADIYILMGILLNRRCSAPQASHTGHGGVVGFRPLNIYSINKYPWQGLVVSHLVLLHTVVVFPEVTVQHLYNVRPLRSLGWAGQCSNTLDWFLPLAVVCVAHFTYATHRNARLGTDGQDTGGEPASALRDCGLLHPSVRHPLRCRKWARLL